MSQVPLTLDVVDIDGATQIDATVSVGVDDTGYDVKFFGATSGKSLLWDESADSLIVAGTSQVTNTAIASVAISGVSRASNTVTVTNSAVHGLTQGDIVNLNGVSDTSFNGYFTVASISSTTVFTFAQTAANATSSGGFTTEIVYSLLSSGTALSSFAGPVVLNANSAIDGLEITQAGAGDALNITGTTTMTGNSTVSGTLGVTGVLTANAGVVVDNITIDGNEIDVSSGDLTLDVAGDIILDFDGGDLRLKDGGTEIGLITSDGSNFGIFSRVSDKDIIFYGNDNGSTIAALTLDMSTGGTAYFSDDVRLTDNHALRLGTDSDIVFYHDNSNWLPCE